MPFFKRKEVEVKFPIDEGKAFGNETPFRRESEWSSILALNFRFFSKLGTSKGRIFYLEELISPNGKR